MLNFFQDVISGSFYEWNFVIKECVAVKIEFGNVINKVLSKGE